MRISSTLRIGEHHVNYCEDYLLISEIGNNRSVLAVMDGCSMGTDSHLIATLTGKLLRKISLEYSYHTFITKTTDDLGFALENIVKRLFHELKNIKQLVQLNKEELLCTLLIAVIDA